jgi:hypothetical protein
MPDKRKWPKSKGPTGIDDSEYTLPAADTTTTEVSVDVKPDPHIYTAKEIKFLDVYCDTLDKATALKEAGLKLEQVKRNKYLMNELEMLQRIAQKKHRLRMAAAKHLDLMEKFEDEFDKVKGKDNKAAVGYSSTLARMSETTLRASGEFAEKKTGSGVNLSVNITIGGEQEPLTVEGEVIDVEVEDE